MSRYGGLTCPGVRRYHANRLRACSSGGESIGFLIRGSGVRVPPRLPFFAQPSRSPHHRLLALLGDLAGSERDYFFSFASALPPSAAFGFGLAAAGLGFQKSRATKAICIEEQKEATETLTISIEAD